MRHVYVLMDNDAPLFVCFNKHQIEQTLENEQQKLKDSLLSTVERNRAMYSATEYQQAMREAELRLSAHYLYYRLVPVAPNSISAATVDARGALNPNVRRRKQGD